MRLHASMQVLPPLLRAVNTPANTQLLYELCMCVWQLTFSEASAKALAAAGAVRVLIGVARTAQVRPGGVTLLMHPYFRRLEHTYARTHTRNHTADTLTVTLTILGVITASRYPPNLLTADRRPVL